MAAKPGYWNHRTTWGAIGGWTLQALHGWACRKADGGSWKTGSHEMTGLSSQKASARARQFREVVISDRYKAGWL